jgi:hypothetical protein
MTNSPTTPSDELNIKSVQYPAGSRFIGPGDDVVMSAAKLEKYIFTAIAADRKALVGNLPKWSEMRASNTDQMEGYRNAMVDVIKIIEGSE